MKYKTVIQHWSANISTFMATFLFSLVIFQGRTAASGQPPPLPRQTNLLHLNFKLLSNRADIETDDQCALY